MKAIIFNSGLGKRMGKLTENKHKSMVTLNNGESIFERQIRILSECGIKNFIITVGPFKEQLIEVSKQERFKHLTFNFVDNPIYNKTNYIYSMYLARKYIDSDILLLHGDLVFNKKLIEDILTDKRQSLVTINKKTEQPKEDFKARVSNGLVKKIATDIFDRDCYALQPLYKLSYETIISWLDKVSEFIKSGNDQVYAENALNEILDNVELEYFPYEKYFVAEVDTSDDLSNVSGVIRKFDFNEQDIFHSRRTEKTLKSICMKESVTKLFVVTTAFHLKTIEKILKKSDLKSYHLFTNFNPNPTYEQIKTGVKEFQSFNPDFILSFGGGSAIDVAKAIKFFSKQKTVNDMINQEYIYSPIKHLAIPTTAGTGSESTRYSVLYYKDEKQTLAQDSIIPEYVILNSLYLKTLPLYQKKATMLDALSQAIESYWSINSTEQSKEMSEQAILLILNNYKQYLNNDLKSSTMILQASNLSGKAINISQTTAAHALSYKITSLYGVAHGHAVALSLPHIWEHIYNNYSQSLDKRGPEYLLDTLTSLAKMFGTNDVPSSIKKFIELYKSLELVDPLLLEEKDMLELVASVNVTRLGNTPVKLTTSNIKSIYQTILINTDLLELQKEILNIMIDVDKFCKKHDITYYLGEGTLLGAVRHGGFIPWDDDADILMTRKNYEKFLRISQKEFPSHLRVETPGRQKTHYVLQTKVRKISGYNFEQKKEKGILGKGGPFIDIFPLDNVPSAGGKKQIAHGLFIHRLRRVMFYKLRVRTEIVNLNTFIIFVLSRIIPLKLLRKIISFMMTKYNNSKNQFYVNWTSYYPSYRQTFSKTVFGKPEFVKFEGTNFPVPAKYDCALTSIYGDYMKLPELQSRRSHHNFSKINLYGKESDRS